MSASVWFDNIILPEEQVEIGQGLEEIATKLTIARLVILMLPAILDERFGSLTVAFDNGLHS